MKKVFLLFLIMATPLLAFSQRGKSSVNDLVMMNLKGAVKEVRHFAFTPKYMEEDSIVLSPLDFFGTHNFILKFNERGWLNEKIELRLNQEDHLFPDAIWKYTYDRQERLSSETITFRVTTPDTASFHYAYPNDSLMTIAEKQNRQTKMTYRYTQDDRTEEFIAINRDSSYIGKTYFEKDTFERIIRREDYNNMPRLQNLTINFYQDSIFRTPYKTIETNLRTGRMLHIENLLDEHGNMISQKVGPIQNGESKITTYTYLYDAGGNWIEKREFIDNQLRKIFLREIDYYQL